MYLRLRSAALRILSAVVAIGIALLVAAPTGADAIVGDLSAPSTAVRASTVVDVTLTFTAPAMGTYLCGPAPPDCTITGGSLGIGVPGTFSTVATDCGSSPTWNTDYSVWETDDVNLPEGGTCTFTVYGLHTPDHGGSVGFWSYVRPDWNELAGALAGHTAFVRVLAPDGTGGTGIAATGWTSAQELTAGHTTTLTLTYTADAGGLFDGTVSFTLPDDWSAPAEHVSTTLGSVSTDGQSIVVHVPDLAGYDSFDVTYTGTVGGMTDALGWASIVTKEKSNSAGTLTETASQASVKVRPPDGSGTVTVSGDYGITMSPSHLKVASGREAHLEFDYAPDGFLGDSADVTLTVPDTWPAPQTANAAGPGYVRACGWASCGVLPLTVIVSGRTIHVDSHSSTRGMTVHVWYTGTSPGGETTEDWVVTERSTAEGTLTAIDTSPSVSREVAHIAFLSVDGTESGHVVAGVSIPISIYAFTQFAFVDTTFENSVQLTAPVRCSAGCGTTARFSHGALLNYPVTLTQAATGIYLTATLLTGTRPWGDSFPFDVLPAAVHHMTFTSPTTTLLSGRARTLTVELRDRFENVEAGDDATQVTFARTSGPGSVSGLGSATVSHGIAGLSVTGGAAGSVTIQAATTGLPYATTTFAVVPDIPAIAGFAPAQGIVGATVIVDGTNFTRAQSVALNGTSATFTVLSDTRLTFQVPSTTTGSIAITTPSGTGTSSGAFTVILLPTIDDVAPAEAGVHATVTVTGSHFAGTTSVTVGGTSAPFTVVSDSTLTFTVPAGATDGPIVVTNPADSNPSPGSFHVLDAPVVLSFSPGSGPVGTSVTITGTNLTGTVGVMIGSIVAVPTSVSATEVVFTIPPGASTGVIRILNPAGSVAGPGSFTVTG